MGALTQISIEQAKEIAAKVGLKPAKVKGTEILRFSKEPSGNIQEISWDEFKKILEKNRLEIHASGSWMKIMRKR